MAKNNQHFSSAYYVPSTVQSLIPLDPHNKPGGECWNYPHLTGKETGRKVKSLTGVTLILVLSLHGVVRGHTRPLRQRKKRTFWGDV